MPTEKMIIIFIAGNPLSEQNQPALVESIRAELHLPNANIRLIQPQEWQNTDDLIETSAAESETQVKLLTQQKAYMQSRRWPFSNDAIAAAFRDMGANAELGTLYFVYAFNQQKLFEAEAHADSLHVEWVPAKKYRRPAVWLFLLALGIFALPLTLSLLFPDWLGAGWAILDLIALWGAVTLAWRGSIRRLRRYQRHHTETCGGCGHHNAVTNVVTFNCEKCNQELAYELVSDLAERAVRIQQVKCPYCNTSNALTFRRTRFSCQRCEVKQASEFKIDR